MSINAENEKLDKALKIVWSYIKNVKNIESKDIDSTYAKLLDDINLLYPTSTSDLARAKVEELIKILYEQNQLKCIDNFSYVTHEHYVTCITLDE